jgi:hypothetical protein
MTQHSEQAGREKHLFSNAQTGAYQAAWIDSLGQTPMLDRGNPEIYPGAASAGTTTGHGINWIGEVIAVPAIGGHLQLTPRSTWAGRSPDYGNEIAAQNLTRRVHFRPQGTKDLLCASSPPFAGNVCLPDSCRSESSLVRRLN